MFDPKEVKKDFPILARPIVYLDNAATSQKPNQVIDAISDFYRHHNANVHRGIHVLSEEATSLYEEARKMVAEFVGAASSDEVIFTSGTTESINLVAFGWGMANLTNTDKVLVLESEHHSDLVPWQIVCEKTGAQLIALSVNEDGELSLDEVRSKLSEGNVKLIALSHASNVLGTIFPVKEVCKLAKEFGTLVCVDGAQAVPHMPINVQSLGCDFYSFSGHKMLGPTGIGVLYIKRELQDRVNPLRYGGGMIDEVSIDRATWANGPEKFEGGTPNIEGAVGLAVAIQYLKKLGMENIQKHNQELNGRAIEKLSEIEGLKILGPKNPEKRTGLVSFVISGLHPHDIATILDSAGVAVRSGHHCAMPLHKKLQISASTRASWYVYNTKEDIDALLDGLEKARARLL